MILKGLSHCQKFGFDMSWVKNSSQESLWDVGCCRTRRHIMYIIRECLRKFQTIQNSRQYYASKLGGAILVLISQLTRALSYSCHIHCRLLLYVCVCSRCPQTTAESLQVHYGKWTTCCILTMIFMQRCGLYTTASLQVFSTTVRQRVSASFVRVRRDHLRGPINGAAALSSIQFQHRITQDEFHQQYISELIIWSTFYEYTLTFKIIIVPKTKIKVLLCVKHWHTYQRYLNFTLGGEILVTSYKTRVMSALVERISY